MLEVTYCTSFKKDLKKYRHKPHILDELTQVVKLLTSEKALPAKYKNHSLVGKFGQYNDVQKLHLKPDDLLVYYKVEGISIVLVAMGSHSALFK